MKYSVSIDVPKLEEGLRFYRDALGLTEVADDTRRHERHWTPLHIDFQVDDYESVLARVRKAGAICEQKFEMAGRPPIAFCSDPFGNGFCILGHG